MKYILEIISPPKIQLKLKKYSDLVILTLSQVQVISDYSDQSIIYLQQPIGN